jgi:hypothetical protein
MRDSHEASSPRGCYTFEQRRLVKPGLTTAKAAAAGAGDKTAGAGDKASLLQLAAAPGSSSRAGGWRHFRRRLAPSCKELMYVCDGDRNGVVHYIGTEYGSKQWVNPVASKALDIKASSPPSRYTDPKVCVCVCVCPAVVGCAVRVSSCGVCAAAQQNQVVSPAATFASLASPWPSQEPGFSSLLCHRCLLHCLPGCARMCYHHLCALTTAALPPLLCCYAGSSFRPVLEHLIRRTPLHQDAPAASSSRPCCCCCHTQHLVAAGLGPPAPPAVQLLHHSA